MKILSDAQSYLNKLRDKWAGSSISLQLIVAATILIFIAIITIWIVDKIFIYVVARGYVEDIADVFNLNKNLAQAIALTIFLLGVYFVGKVFSFSRTSRRVGYLGIMALLIGHSLLLWHGTSGQFFLEQSGQAKATKCYVLTRDGEVRFRELGHNIDPETGLQCREVTFMMSNFMRALMSFVAKTLPENRLSSISFFTVWEVIYPTGVRLPAFAPA